MAEHEHADNHPGVGEYVEIGAFLALLTAIEVGLFFAGVVKVILIPTLIFLTVMKFALVVLWFMHLRFDHKVFRRLFLVGVALAGVVFSVVLLISP
jgi:cytochrome c oxidase subunit 4